MSVREIKIKLTDKEIAQLVVLGKHYRRSFIGLANMAVANFLRLNFLRLKEEQERQEALEQKIARGECGQPPKINIASVLNDPLAARKAAVKARFGGEKRKV